VIACALVQPTKSLSDVKTSSVRRKLKDKAFARAVIRDDIWKGMEEIGADFDEHVQFVIDALKPVAEQIGLNP
jgi:predicted hydrolase (HD superfamily)